MTEQQANAISSPSDSSAKVPEIHEHESFRRYKLIDLDNTQIERTAKELIEGSKLLSKTDLWIANFSATIERVREWCNRLRDKLQIALVEIRSNKVLFYFVPQSDRYDLSLGSEMTALEVELGGSAGIGYVETLQVPVRSLERFAGPGSLLVWSHEGQGEISP
ncbi:hypothetical protein [Fontivita pretiosa]|uniref:hypothetical protein n=1 Tax=Fontivita pretiosa TaxID=2989684 RepID=UPI003D1810E3